MSSTKGSSSASVCSSRISSHYSQLSRITSNMMSLVSSLSATNQGRRQYGANTSSAYFNRPRWLVSPDASTLVPPVFSGNVVNTQHHAPSSQNLCSLNNDVFCPGFLPSKVATTSILSNRSNIMPNNAVTARTRSALGAWAPQSSNRTLNQVDVSFPTSVNSAVNQHSGYPTLFGGDMVSTSTAAPPAFAMDGRSFAPEPRQSSVHGYQFPASRFSNGRHDGPVIPRGQSPPFDWVTNNVSFPSAGPVSDFHGRRSLESSVGTGRTEEILLDHAVFNEHDIAIPTNNAAGYTKPPVSRRAVAPKSTTDPTDFEGLVRWISEWLYSVVNESGAEHASRSFGYFTPAGICMLAATRIHRILNAVSHPEDVAILALWYILRLTQPTKSHALDSSNLTFFDHLVRSGAHTLDEIMFRTFVTAAMLSDKCINDNSFSAKTWNKLTSISMASLNETEIFALQKLDWNTQISGHEWVAWLRDLRQYHIVATRHEVAEATTRVAANDVGQLLDHLLLTARVHGSGESAVLISRSPENVHMSTSSPAAEPSFSMLPQPAEWCPEADPIFHKQRRTIGVAPGAHRVQSFAKTTTTALDLLQSIISVSSPPLSHNFSYRTASPQFPQYEHFDHYNTGRATTFPARFQHAPAPSHLSWIATQG